MTPFRSLTSVAAPMPQADVDTDIIFPARFLLLTDKKGLGRHAFHDKRFHADGRERADFVLNRAPWREAGILVAGPNFGCGSSREQAPWALADIGLRCIIACGFGEIFKANCYANGLLPIVLRGRDHARVMAEAVAGRSMTVDLMGCRIELAAPLGDTLCAADGLQAAGSASDADDAAAAVEDPAGDAILFDVPQRQRDALLAGLDEIGLIQAHETDRIAAFEQRQRLRQAWLAPTALDTPQTPGQANDGPWCSR